MSEVKVNKISPRTNCGTTTLGDSGDTFTIPAGVSITNNGTASGFGSTGEVSWNTTKITADPGPAATGVGYFTDTSGAAFNVTLPASPSAGNVVAVADYANTWDTNNLTILRNGSNIEGAASDFICNTEGASVTFVYVDATKGWVVTNTGNSTGAQNANYVAATGGTITTCGNFKIHTFTGPGTFTVTCAGNSVGSNTVDYLVVAGGGGGGHWASGGGGGGGFRESPGTASGCYSVSPRGAAPAVALPVSVQGYPIAVGGGGAKGTGPGAGNGVSGVNSTFSTITSAGGGFGGGYNVAGSNGGSGGGGGHPSQPGGTGNTPPVNPAQGMNGGTGNAGGNPGAGAGAGGATEAGVSGSPSAAGRGGAGATTSISGSPTAYAGGGGGGADGSGVAAGSPCGTGGQGGSSGDSPRAASNGTTNRGGGGGGVGGPSSSTAGNGGSGIVIIRYKFQ
jgi:hypothetical protein